MLVWERGVLLSFARGHKALLLSSIQPHGMIDPEQNHSCLNGKSVQMLRIKNLLQKQDGRPAGTPTHSHFYTWLQGLRGVEESGRAVTACIYSE